VHSYKRPGTGDDVSTHEHRQTRGSTLHDVYPPLSTLVGNDREPNLLSASPTMLRQSTFPQIIPKIPPPHESQMLHIPPSIANEHTVQSAPAAIRQTRSEDPPMPTTSKGNLLFDSTSGKGTLMSFPSVTDSAPSEWGAVDVDKDGKVVRKGKSRELPTAPKIPLKSPKNIQEVLPTTMMRRVRRCSGMIRLVRRDIMTAMHRRRHPMLLVSGS